jgi:putative transposase
LQKYNTIIGKLLAGVNRRKFKRFVDKYNGNYYVKHFDCWSQFVSIFLGQISNSSSIREIVDFINCHSNQQYHLGLKKNIAKSTLAEANAKRDWHIYRDIFLDLIKTLKQKEYFQTKEIIEIIDSTPIMLNLKEHPWIEKTMKVKGLKTHVVFNLNQEMPVYFDITGARTNDINVAKTIELKSGVTYVADKGYTDYNWWHEINEAGAFFVTRLKKKAKIAELSEIQNVDKAVSSQIIALTNKFPGGKRKNNYANKPLKKVIVQREGKEPLILVTNDFSRSDAEIGELYKQRWQIELFFKWIKQNLKIKKFLGRSENAIKTQICIAMISFVLIKLANDLREVCENISTKNLLKIIGNSIFNCLKLRDYGRKRWKNPNQLQFEWVLIP